jgi:hypothetical protein
MTSTTTRLRAAVRDSGTPLASSLGDTEPAAGDPADDELALLAAGGPRVASAHRADVEIAVAAVDEGYRLHYATSRALRIDDADLALLAGDRMYALGLARLATIGDLTAIAELADVIGLAAQAHAGDDADLAEAAWQAGATAIAQGPTPETDAAKKLARAGDPGAARALRDAAQALLDTSAT